MNYFSTVTLEPIALGDMVYCGAEQPVDDAIRRGEKGIAIGLDEPTERFLEEFRQADADRRLLAKEVKKLRRRLDEAKLKIRETANKL